MKLGPVPGTRHPDSKGALNLVSRMHELDGRAIVEGIRESEAFLLVLSEESAQSEQVEREAERASSYKKPIFTIRLGGAEPGPNLEYYMAARQWFDCSGEISDQQIDALASDIRKVLQIEQALVTQSPRFLSRLSGWVGQRPMRIRGAAVTLVITAIGWLGYKLIQTEAPSRIPPVSVVALARNQTDDYEQTKGVYLDGVRRHADSVKKHADETSAPATAGIKYNIRLRRDGEERIFSPTSRFLDDDRFQLQFELNLPSYVYVLHRTALGEPDRFSKGIEFESANEAPKPSPYKLLFPRGKASQLPLPAGKDQLIPNEGVFRMDQSPGLEKLFVVVSPSPLDLSKYFDYTTFARHDQQSDEIEVARLTQELVAMGSNAQIAESKGITVEDADSFGVSRDPKKPMVVVINLRHYHRKDE
jgi:hypothetical protein